MGGADPTAAPPTRHLAASRSYPGWIPGLARLLLHVFFGRIEVVGLARVPAGRPLLYLANHNNGLVDPVLVVGMLPGRPRFLAKHTLWGNPVLRPFLALARAIPVYRPQDAPSSAPGEEPPATAAAPATSANEESFRRCREVLAEGGAVALFPEGKSHSEPALAALKTGAARILLGLPAPVRRELAVVPVGLLFDAPAIFRSRVLLQVGEPLAAADVAGGEPAAAEAVRQVTAVLAVGLAEVTLSFSSWDEARLLARVADLWLQPQPELPARPPLARRVAARRRVLDRYRQLARERPQRLAPLVAALAAYDQLLSAHGLRDEQVGAAYPLLSVLAFLAESVFLLLIRLPLAVAGTLLDYVPYRLCGIAGALAAREPDQPATFKLFGGIVLLPLFWAAEATFAGWRWGAWAALAVLVLGPLGGWAAVRFRDRFRYLVFEARAFLLLRGPGGAGEELRRRRAALRREVLALAAELGEPPVAAD